MAKVPVLDAGENTVHVNELDMAGVLTVKDL